MRLAETSLRRRRGVLGRSRSSAGRWAAKQVLGTVTRFTDCLVFYLEGQGDEGYETKDRARLWGKEPMEVRPHSWSGQHWSVIPQCWDRRCVGGQHASDKEMVVALCYLRDLLRGEEQSVGRKGADIASKAASIARANLARSNRTLPGLCEDPADFDSKEIFRRAWPWRLPYAEQTGNMILEEYWHKEYVSRPFEPSWRRAETEIPF